MNVGCSKCVTGFVLLFSDTVLPLVEKKEVELELKTEKTILPLAESNSHRRVQVWLIVAQREGIKYCPFGFCKYDSFSVLFQRERLVADVISPAGVKRRNF